MLAVFLLGGGSLSWLQVRHFLRQVQKQQRQLVYDIDQGKQIGKKGGKKGAAVDKLFFQRLLRILKICVPSPLSEEMCLIWIQAFFLVSRTLLTDIISRQEARAGRALISQDMRNFEIGLTHFALTAVPAAAVNASLKYMQNRIKLAFQKRLTLHLHQAYCLNRSYYAASVLGGLQNADQRITEDVEKFSFTVSELYSHTFKPLLDIILFTRSLASVMGYKGQLLLYCYYILSGGILRWAGPPLAQMTAQETALTGAMRSAHQRLVAHAEEIAYNDPPGGPTECKILDGHLFRYQTYSRLSSIQRLVQQFLDGYFIKYFASVVALLVYAAPVYAALRNQKSEDKSSRDKLTSDYIRSMRLLQNTSRAVGDLVLLYKRVAALAGYTSRVSELLEQIRAISREDFEHRDLFRKNLSCTDLKMDGIVTKPQRTIADSIKFEGLSLQSPDGQPLIRDLNLEIPIGQSTIIVGPNGSGKSSLFRVMAGLWPLQCGKITTPPSNCMFYLSQRPYLVSGSLRDQLLYPDAFDSVYNEERLEEALEAVELDYLLQRGSGWEQVQKWEEVLSGGEKQRIAMARLLYHKPRYAILDECTSAVSSEGELLLYRACANAGITMVSIAHRSAVIQFHSVVLELDDSEKGWNVKILNN